jgi:uncharacterized protein
MPDVEYLEEMAERHRTPPRPRLCYLEIPAIDAQESARFYEAVFGWDIRDGDTDRPSFAYPSADVTGAWVTGRAVSREPGPLPYIWVDDIKSALAQIQSCGGEIIDASPISIGGDSWIATFRDPAGNVIGLHQSD